MLELDSIRSDDLSGQMGIQAYLLENADKGVRERPSDQVRRAVETGLPLRLSEEGVTCACSFVYEFSSPGAGLSFSEIGTMRVTANGLGLQQFLASFHLFQLRLENDPFNSHIPFAVVTSDSASEHVLMSKVGLKTWQPPEQLIYARASGGTPFAGGKPVLVADKDAIGNAFKSLREWHVEGRTFRTPTGGKEILVNLGWFRAEYLDL